MSEYTLKVRAAEVDRLTGSTLKEIIDELNVHTLKGKVQPLNDQYGGTWACNVFSSKSELTDILDEFVQVPIGVDLSQDNASFSILYENGRGKGTTEHSPYNLILQIKNNSAEEIERTRDIVLSKIGYGDL